MRKTFLAMVLALSAVCGFAQGPDNCGQGASVCQSPASTSISGTALSLPSNGGVTVSFTYNFGGTIASTVVAVKGCIAVTATASACDNLDSYTQGGGVVTINRTSDLFSVKAPTAAYSYYVVTPTWSSGSGTFTVIERNLNTSKLGGSGSSGGPSPYSSTPAMDGAGSAGASSNYSRGDHVHPTDTSRAASNASTTVNSQTCALGGSCTIPVPVVAGSDGNLQMKSGSNLAAAHINDSGITITASEPFDAGQNYENAEYYSHPETAGSGGVAAGTLVTLDTSNPSLVITAPINATGVLGITATAGLANAGVRVVLTGDTPCVADNNITAGHLVGVGSTIGGRCKDLGVTTSQGVTSTTQIIGKAEASGTTGNPVLIHTYGAGHYGTLVVAASTNTSVCSDNSCTQISGKENVSNKSTDGTMASDSDTLYPSQKSVVTYVGAHAGGSVGAQLPATVYGVPPSGAQIPYVKQVSSVCFVPDAASWSCSFAKPTTAGTAIVAYWNNRLFSGSCSVSLSGGSYSWSDGGDTFADSGISSSFSVVGVALNGAGGKSTITYTHTGGTGLDCAGMVLYEVANVATSSAIDQANQSNGCTTLITNTNPNDINLAWCSSNGEADTYSAKSPWTLGATGSASSAPGPTSVGTEYLSSSVGGDVTAAFTSTGSGAAQYHGAMLSLKGAAALPSSIPDFMPLASVEGGLPTYHSVSSAYQVQAGDFTNPCGHVSATDTLTVTLVPSTSQPAAGTCVFVTNDALASVGKTVTVAPSGQNLYWGGFNSSVNMTLPAGQSAVIYSDGTNYRAQGFAYPGNPSNNRQTVFGLSPSPDTGGGAYNTWFGAQNGNASVSGNGNMIFGVGSGGGLSSGNFNVLMGFQNNVSSGSYNVEIGDQAANSNGAGNGNVILGTFAGTNFVRADYNIVIGYNADIYYGGTFLSHFLNIGDLLVADMLHGLVVWEAPATSLASDCGTSPTLESGSNNIVGAVTVGTSSSNSCIVHFSTSYNQAPFCTVTNETGTVVGWGYSRSTAAITVTATSGLDGSKFDYHCFEGATAARPLP